MKHQARFSLIIALLLFFTGMFILITERADARAGGGHGFSGGRSFGGGSRSYSSHGGRYSSSHSSPRPLTKEEREALAKRNKWLEDNIVLAIIMLFSVFASSLSIFIKNDDSNVLDSAKISGGIAIAVVWGSTYIQSEIIGILIILASIAIAVCCYKYQNLIDGKVSTNTNTFTPSKRFNRVIDFSEITQKDLGFSAVNFISRVKKAFLQIQESWSKNDLSKSEIFMADGTYEQFQIQINEMIANKIIDKMEGLVIKEAYITKIESNKGYDSIYVVITAIGKNYRINSITNKFIEGDYGPTPFTEIWCFMRRTGSKTINNKGLIEGFCPNCGTPIEGSRLSKCPSCGSQLRSGEHDWVLTGITQASEWRETHNKTIPGINKLLEIDPDFNIQNLEDRLSVMFWRMCEAKRTCSIDPIRKIATDEFIEKFKNNNVGFGKYKNPAVGSIEIIGIVTDEPGFHYLLGQITWSGKNSSGYDAYNKSLFVLKRNSACKTDSKKSFTSMHCPNCGAPMKISAENFCEYCNTAVNDFNKDWMLESILYFNSNESNVLVKRARQSQYGLQTNQPMLASSMAQTSRMAQVNQSVYQTQRNQVMQVSSQVNVKELYSNLDYSDIKSISEKDLMKITIAMMLADGIIDARERQLIREISCKRTTLNEQDIERIIETMKRLPNPVDYTLNNTAVPNNLTLLKVLINIAAADGNISNPEILMLRKVAARMHVTPVALRDMINAVYETNWNKK